MEMEKLARALRGVIREENVLAVDEVKHEVLGSLSIDTEEMIERQVDDKLVDIQDDIKDDVLDDVKDALEWRIEQAVREQVEDKMKELTRDLRVAFKWEVE